jgi:hypothetical protein
VRKRNIPATNGRGIKVRKRAITLTKNNNFIHENITLSHLLLCSHKDGTFNKMEYNCLLGCDAV